MTEMFPACFCLHPFLKLWYLNCIHLGSLIRWWSRCKQAYRRLTGDTKVQVRRRECNFLHFHTSSEFGTWWVCQMLLLAYPIESHTRHHSLRGEFLSSCALIGVLVSITMSWPLSMSRKPTWTAHAGIIHICFFTSNLSTVMQASLYGLVIGTFHYCDFFQWLELLNSLNYFSSSLVG